MPLKTPPLLRGLLRGLRRGLLLPALLTALLGLTQCGAGDGAYPLDQLPDATQTGAGTAGCMIDGQPWTAKRFDATAAFGLYHPYATTHYLVLSFNKAIDDTGHPNDNAEIMLYVPEITQAGTFLFDQTPASLNTFGGYGTPAYATFTLRPAPNRSGTQERVTGADATGRLVVTRFTPGPAGSTSRGGTASGTFEFSCRRPGAPGEPLVHLTEGRFDCTL